MKRTDQPLQLQLWDVKTKSYVVDSRCPGKLLEGEDFYGKRTAWARRIAGALPWRIARADRPLKPRYSVPRNTASDRTVQQVIEAYLSWAIDRHVSSITLYKGQWHPYLARCTPNRRYITREEHFAVTRSDEPRPRSRAATSAAHAAV